MNNQIKLILKKHPSVFFGSLILFFMVLIAVFASEFSNDPMKLNPIERLKSPENGIWFGTDMYGRDIFARTLHGTQISLIAGISVAIISTFIGTTIGLFAGYFSLFDKVIMRLMDGIMAIPSILLAIALVGLAGASLFNVIIAISIPEIPRFVRIVRSVVLSVKEQNYIEAVLSVGVKTHNILFKHILPNSIAPIIVQATYVCASAMIWEAILSFLGAGTPPDIPTWGNIIAEGRVYFQRAPWIIFFPGLFLGITVLSVNLLGDGLRDGLDPKISRQMR